MRVPAYDAVRSGRRPYNQSRLTGEGRKEISEESEKGHRQEYARHPTSD